MTALAQTLAVLEASDDPAHQRDVMSPLVVDWTFRSFLRTTYNPFQPVGLKEIPLPPLTDAKAIDEVLDREWEGFIEHFEDVQAGNNRTDSLLLWMDNPAWPVFARVLNGRVRNLSPVTARSMWGDIPSIRFPAPRGRFTHFDAPVYLEAVPYGMRVFIVMTAQGLVGEYTETGGRVTKSRWHDKDVSVWPLACDGYAEGAVVDAVRANDGNYYVSDVVPLPTMLAGTPSRPYSDRLQAICSLPCGNGIGINIPLEADNPQSAYAMACGALDDEEVEFVRIRKPAALYVLGDTEDIVEAWSSDALEA